MKKHHKNDKVPKYIKPYISSYGLDELTTDWNFEIFGQNPECTSIFCDPV